VITVRYRQYSQEYSLVGFETYVRDDGRRKRRVTLAIWQSACAKCGDVFECR